MAVKEFLNLKPLVMYQTPTPPANVRPAIVRNLKFHSYKAYLAAIVVLLALNLIQPANLLGEPANASQDVPTAPAPTRPAEWIPQESEFNSYRLVIQSEWQFVLMDGDRVVHVFQRSYKPNANLFHVVDVDNE